MKQLGDLLPPLPLSASPSGVAVAPPLAGCEQDLVHVLAGGLPSGHLHVWGGPTGSGKTCFLLCLLHGAARHGRRVAYATYDLPASTLALRLLSMACGVPADDLLRTSGAGEGAAASRASLERLPFWFLEARGLGVASIQDRIVRMPFRPDVLAIDYLQAVVREPGTDLGHALRDLSALASRLHIAVVCALRADPISPEESALRADTPSPERESPDRSALDRAVVALRHAGGHADRVGWIAPASGSQARRAEVLENRYGDRPTLPLRF